jgi:peroxiredoxin
VSSWKGLAKIAAEFDALGAVLVGVAVDTAEHLRAFRRDHALPFRMLSDPMLETARTLGVPTASRANYAATAVLHPMILKYPKRSYLQPALFVWTRDGTLAHEWRQTESSLTNLYGARGRPDPRQVLAIVRSVLR